MKGSTASILFYRCLCLTAVLYQPLCLPHAILSYCWSYPKVGKIHSYHCFYPLKHNYETLVTEGVLCDTASQRFLVDEQKVRKSLLWIFLPHLLYSFHFGQCCFCKASLLGTTPVQWGWNGNAMLVDTTLCACGCLTSSSFLKLPKNFRSCMFRIITTISLLYEMNDTIHPPCRYLHTVYLYSFFRYRLAIKYWFIPMSLWCDASLNRGTSSALHLQSHIQNWYDHYLVSSLGACGCKEISSSALEYSSGNGILFSPNRQIRFVFLHALQCTCTWCRSPLLSRLTCAITPHFNVTAIGKDPSFI
jgi:hypothetical protein